MILVIDTNVLISAFVFQGFSAEVFDYCILNERVIFSPWILNELKDKLENRFEVEESVVLEILGLLSEKAEIVIPKNELPIICRDEDDNNILQLAAFVHADYIITGDKDLLSLKNFGQTKIINPRSFFDSLEG